MNLTEGILYLGLVIILTATIVAGYSNALEKNRTAELMRAVYILRGNVEQIFAGAPMDESLTTQHFIDAGLVPDELVRSGQPVTKFGGSWEIGPETTGNASYHIAIGGLPKSACQQLSRLSPDSWMDIQVATGSSTSVPTSGTSVLNDGEFDPQAALAGCSSNGKGNGVVFLAP
jgi:hypothetical protein